MLGLTKSPNLTWNAHIEEAGKKASERFYLLGQLKRAKLSPADLILLYNTCVRSVVDDAVQVFYSALPQYLIDELVRIYERATSIIISARATIMHVKSKAEHLWWIILIHYVISFSIASHLIQTMRWTAYFRHCIRIKGII